MSKKKNLNNLSLQMMYETEEVEVLLEQIIFHDDMPPKIEVLARIALKKSKKISNLNEKIGKILKR